MGSTTAEALKANIAAEAEGEIRRGYTTTTEYDSKRHCVVLRVETVERVPDRWSLVLADTVHGYRTCLDHIAWALYKRGSTPSLGRRGERRVAFPIASTRKDFNNSLARLLPGVSRADRAIVRRHQPYLVGERRLHLHVFTTLRIWSNKDKHETLPPLLAIPDDRTIEISNPRDCTITRVPTSGRRVPLEAGAELHRVYVKKTGPNPKLEMESYVALEIAMSQFLDVHEWLAQAQGFVFKLLSEFQAPPLTRLNGIGIYVRSTRDMSYVEVAH